MSLKTTLADRIARAVLRFTRLGGQGVLVRATDALDVGFVVTAAHCIGWTAEGYMALGHHYYEEIMAADGRRLKVSPLSVEPVNDLAVLGAPDSEASPDLADAFEEFCRATPSVRLAISKLELFKPFTAYAFTHDKGVIPIRVQQCAPAAATLAFETDEPIEGGTSGGPVVTRDGRLLGIISFSGGVACERRQTGSIPRVHLAAPVWLARQMIPPATRMKLDAALPPGRIPSIRSLKRTIRVVVMARKQLRGKTR